MIAKFYKIGTIFLFLLNCLTSIAIANPFNLKVENFSIKIGSKSFEIPLTFIPTAKIQIAYIDLKSNKELIKALATEFTKYIQENTAQIDIIATPEANTIALAYAISEKTGKDYIVLSKRRRAGMGGKALKVKMKSITTEHVQELWIGEADIEKIKGKNILLIDDVVSSGGTLTAAKQLIKEAGGILNTPAVVCFYEGQPTNEAKAISETVLPVIPMEGG